jgi:hypothetical protein
VRALVEILVRHAGGIRGLDTSLGRVAPRQRPSTINKQKIYHTARRIEFRAKTTVDEHDGMEKKRHVAPANQVPSPPPCTPLPPSPPPKTRQVEALPKKTR